MESRRALCEINFWIVLINGLLDHWDCSALATCDSWLSVWQDGTSTRSSNYNPLFRIEPWYTVHTDLQPMISVSTSCLSSDVRSSDWRLYNKRARKVSADELWCRPVAVSEDLTGCCLDNYSLCQRRHREGLHLQLSSRLLCTLSGGTWIH